MADFTVKEGNLEPGIADTLKDSTGTVVSIETATGVLFRLLTLDRVTIFERAAQIDDAANGFVSYAWIAGDTDIPGVYYAEFTVSWLGPRIQTTPPRGYIIIVIEPRF